MEIAAFTQKSDELYHKLLILPRRQLFEICFENFTLCSTICPHTPVVCCVTVQILDSHQWLCWAQRRHWRWGTESMKLKPQQAVTTRSTWRSPAFYFYMDVYHCKDIIIIQLNMHLYVSICGLWDTQSLDKNPSALCEFLGKFVVDMNAETYCFAIYYMYTIYSVHKSTSLLHPTGVEILQIQQHIKLKVQFSFAAILQNKKANTTEHVRRRLQSLLAKVTHYC